MLCIESRQFSATPPIFGASVGVTQFEFCQDFRQQKTRIPGPSCGVVCEMLHLAISVENQFVTDGQTDGRTDR